MNNMNSTILDHFNQLKSDNNLVRLNAGITLLNHLSQYNTNEDDNKELKHALIRLVRSLGSSTVSARRGFYSTLTVFLTTHPETSIEKLLSIMNTQLHPAGSNSKSENAGIYMGRILLFGAMIRSKLLAQNTIEIQQVVIQNLVSTAKQRSYLSLVSVMFLNDFINQLNNIDSMKKVFWPIIESELAKPWSEQTLDTFYILLLVKDKYPSLINHKFLKEHLGVNDIIVKESIEDIIKLLTGLSRIVSCHHPVFKLFCEKLTSTALIVDFWRGIDQRFTKPSKSDEYVTLEILRLIVTNIEDKTIIPSLLSSNFMRYMLKRFSNCKKSNNDEILIAFRKVLHLIVSATNDKNIKTKTQLSILKKLILDPGDLMIEKKTGTKVVQIITGNLRLDGIKKLCQLYKNIIENKLTKEKNDTKVEFWTNAERSYAVHLLTRLMGHPETLSDHEWRLDQLTFLFKYGFCEISNVGIELSPQFKDSFYRALDYKLPKLNDVRNLLSALVHYINSKLDCGEICLRSPLNDAASHAWTKVIHLIETLEKNTRITEILPIFHTMNLHMGLQLFLDPDMAIMSINELQCCYEKLIKKPSAQINIDNIVVKEEPYWVEVVVDLLLSLLSRSNHLLRSLVGCVFPHICPYLTPSAVYQILTVLDCNNTQEILTIKDDEDSSDTECESYNDENNVSNSELSSEESKSESDSETLDEDETLNDRLRIAVRQALGDAAVRTDDEDIDVDQINDDEAKRLDESLAAAFKILRENHKTRSKKQEKTSQALTHFRVRVMDLLDIYLDTCPCMKITIDMIIPLFALLEFCIKDPHQKPLEHRIRACLKKLSALKKFKDTVDVDNSLLTTVLKSLIEKGERSTSVCQELSDKLAESCTFLVRCTQQSNLSIETVVRIYTESLNAFFKKRDCILSYILFKNVLQLCWEGNWQLTLVLVDFAFDNSIRYFRRNQALELLLVFYNNNRLLRMDTKYVDIRVKLETTLYNNTINIFQQSYVSYSGHSVSRSSTNVAENVQQKFVSLLLTLLRVIYTHHLPQVWNWQNVKKILTIYKNSNVLSRDAKSAYNKLIMQLRELLDISSMKDNIQLNNNITDVSCNNGTQRNIKPQNKKLNDNLKAEIQPNNNLHKKKKKRKQKEEQTLKKEARELRTVAMSKDLEPFDFSIVNLSESEMDITEVYRNGDTCDGITSPNYPQKRNCEQTVEDTNHKKRKINTNMFDIIS